MKKFPGLEELAVLRQNRLSKLITSSDASQATSRTVAVGKKAGNESWPFTVGMLLAVVTVAVNVPLVPKHLEDIMSQWIGSFELEIFHHLSTLTTQ